jgi:hypothetical protein
MNGSEAERPQAIREALQQIEAEIPRLRRYARYLGHEPDHTDDLVREGLLRAVAEVHTAIASIHTARHLAARLAVRHPEKLPHRGNPPRPASGCAGHHPGRGIFADHPPQPGSGSDLVRAVRCLSQPQRGGPRGAAARGHRGSGTRRRPRFSGCRSARSAPDCRRGGRRSARPWRPGAREITTGAPHAGHQHLIAPCLAISMAEAVLRLGRSAVQASILAPVESHSVHPTRPGT